MTANFNPTFTLTPKSPFAKVTAADTGTDGTGANVKLILTAGADGSFLRGLFLQPLSTSGSTNTSAAALRLYINNGSSVGTASNNALFYEWSLPVVAVNVSATAAALGIFLPFNFQIQSTYAIYGGITAIAANTNWNIFPIEADY